MGTITWVGKNSQTAYEAGLAAAVLLLAEDEREIACIKITTNRFDGHVYELILNRAEGGSTFHGFYQKRGQGTSGVIGREELSAFLAISTDGSALLLGRSPWREDGWECDWKVQLKATTRIPFHEWNC